MKGETVEERPERQCIAGGELRGDALHRRNQSPQPEADAARQQQETIAGVGTVERRAIGEASGHAVPVWKFSGRERCPQRLRAGGRERLDARKVRALPRLFEERDRSFAGQRHDPVVREIADGDDDHRTLACDGADVRHDDVPCFGPIAVTPFVERERGRGDQQHAGDEDDARFRAVGIALQEPEDEQHERRQRDRVRGLAENAHRADRQVQRFLHRGQVNPVDERGDERRQHDEAEAVRAIRAVGVRLAEDPHAQRAQQPQDRAEEQAADRAVDQRDEREASRRHVDLRIEEVQQVRHVQAEDRAGENAFEVGPPNWHEPRRSVLGESRC